MPKPVIEDILWAGTEASLEAHLSQLEKMDRMAFVGIKEADAPSGPRLLTVKDGVGSISIKGPLSNNENFFTAMFGASTYPAIREALVAAAEDPNVKHILLDVNSGGGAVNGVADVANLVRTINDKVKPVSAFTDGNMMSAAYWLGGSAGKVYASNTAMVGSIGVIATHMEQSEALKAEGIGVTVMRAGKYKALANSNEPLTAAAKQQIQDSLDGVYGVFVQHVADMRGASYANADQQMAQGQEFMGEGAVKAGLVDGITSYDALISKLTNDVIDKKTHIPNNRTKVVSTAGFSGSTEEVMPRQALTDQQIAAMAESAAEATAEGETQAAVVAAAAPAAESVQAETEQVAAAPQAAGNELVSYLQAQIKERDEALVQAKVQVGAMTEKLAGFEAVIGDLTTIAAKSLNNMQVALGGAALDLSAASPAAIITQHKQVSATFMDRFKAGGVAAVDAAQTEGKPAVVDPRHMARVNAARFQK